MAASMDKIFAIVKVEDAQAFRCELKGKGYYNGAKRIQKMDRTALAIPITEAFVSKLLEVKTNETGDFQSNNKVAESDKDKQERHILYESDKCLSDITEPDRLKLHALVKSFAAKTLKFQGIQFRLDLIEAFQPSKKARLVSQYDSMVKCLKVLIEQYAERTVKVDKVIHWSDELQSDLPKSWEKHGDLILLPDGCFQHEVWSCLSGTSVWDKVSLALGGKRLARKSTICTDDFRTPQVELLSGEDGWVQHMDNGIKYSYDVTRCMFSSGNVTEKLRVASFDCTGLTVVDLYAGIGYFTLPYLVHAGAEHVHACEWNPHAIEALSHNLQLNHIQHRCTVHAGDNRKLTLRGVADRVNLGLIPSSEDGWPIACQVLKPHTGGVLHIHENIHSIKPTCTKQAENIHSIKPTSTNEEKNIHSVKPTFTKHVENGCNEHITDKRTFTQANLIKTGKSGHELILNSNEGQDFVSCVTDINTGNTFQNDKENNFRQEADDNEYANHVSVETMSKKANIIETDDSGQNLVASVTDINPGNMFTNDELDNKLCSVQRTSPEANIIQKSNKEQDFIGYGTDINTGNTFQNDKLDNLREKTSQANSIETSNKGQNLIDSFTDCHINTGKKLQSDRKFCSDTGNNFESDNRNTHSKCKNSSSHVSCSCKTGTESSPGKDSKNSKSKMLKYRKNAIERKEWLDWAKKTAVKIKELLESTHGNQWNVLVLHIEHVKSYAPHVDHIVLDLECRPKAN